MTSRAHYVGNYLIYLFFVPFVSLTWLLCAFDMAPKEATNTSNTHTHTTITLASDLLTKIQRHDSHQEIQENTLIIKMFTSHIRWIEFTQNFWFFFSSVFSLHFTVFVRCTRIRFSGGSFFTFGPYSRSRGVVWF